MWTNMKLFWICLLLAFGSDSLAVLPPRVEAMLKEATPHWNRYAKTLGNYQVDVEHVVSFESFKGRADGDEPIVGSGTTYHVYGRNLRAGLRIGKILSRPGGRVMGVALQNNKYHVNISERIDGKEGLLHFFKGGMGVDPKRTRESPLIYSAVGYGAGESSIRWIPELLSIAGVKSRFDPDMRMLTLRFREGQRQVLDIVFDDKWRITHCTSEELIQGVTVARTQSNEFDESPSTAIELAIPSVVIWRSDAMDPMKEGNPYLEGETQRFTISNRRTLAMPTKEFFLPFYGFDEDVLNQQAKNAVDGI